MALNNKKNKSSSSPSSEPQSEAFILPELISLRDRLRNMQAVLDQVGSYIYMKDVAGRYTYVNQGVQDIFGTSYKNIVGRDSSAFFESAIVGELQRDDERVIAFGETIEKENQVSIKGKNEKLFFWTVKKPLYNDQGQIIGLSGISTDITALKQMENALRESEAHLRLSQINGGIGTWEADLVNNKQKWLESCIELLGFPYISDPTWDDFLALVYPEDRQRVIDATNDHIEHGKKYDVEYRAILANGNIRWMRSAGQVERDADGKPIIMRGIAQDVTERHENQQRIETLLDEQRAILENRLVGIITVRDRKIVWANSAYETMLGYEKGEVIGLPSRQLYLNEEDYQSVGAAYANIENEAIFRTQHEFVRKDGKHIWLSMSGASLHKDTGESLWVFVDVTERKLAEDNLRIAATAFESHEGIMVTDANNSILQVNHAFTEITGYTAEEVIGKNPNILHSGRQDEAFYNQMWKVINATGRWEGEILNRRKNGEVYPEQLTITVVKDKDGTVINYVASLSDITNNKAAADEIQHLAYYDFLTGLPNRRLLTDRLKQAFASSLRSGRDGALLFVDIDNFKMLNDTLGHSVGDLLLRLVAERLYEFVRSADTVARLSGDEFIVMLEDLSEKDLEAASQAETVANKILGILSQPYLLDSHIYHCTCSIGITLFNDHHSGVEELLKQADIAMYQAKKEGRNTLRFFDRQMQDAINSRASMENDLRDALDRNEFQLYYQIQVDESNHPLGAEALIRWLHPERGLVLPSDFISLAEENGMILPIGQWVLNTACGQLKAWQQDAYTRDLTLSVNVSAKQFRQPDFIEQVQLAIKNHSINPMSLELELTESILLENIEDTVATMNALKEIGIRFSLDDFGTGYSSLQYLKRLPLYQLKIDQSFVRDIAGNNGDQAIVQTIVAMANSLQLNVIAEGVETEAQKQLLLSKGCRAYQGYLFGKPVPIEQFNTELRNIINKPKI